MKRLKDSESGVRFRAVTVLSEWMIQTPLKLQSVTIHQIIERVKDKSVEMRKFVAECIGKAYYKHISSIAFKSYTNIEDTFKSIDYYLSVIPKELWERFHSVPAHIVNCWGYPELDFKLQLLHILQEGILPKPMKAVDSDKNVSKSSNPLELESIRTVNLLVCISTLNSNEKTILGAIFAFKSKIRKELRNFLKLHQELSKKTEPVKVLGNKSSNKETIGTGAQLDAQFRMAKQNLLVVLPVMSSKFPSNSTDFHKKCIQMLDKLHDTK